jgi:predicted permease
VPYARLFVELAGVETGIGLAIGNMFVVFLLVLVSANVALLVFARATGRETEIAVRSALGAGRARIVAQLFVEGLVLASLAALVGLWAARYGVRSLLNTLAADQGVPMPFWVTDSLTPSTVAYAAGLTILCAAIVGVLPALRITGRALDARLRQSAAGAGGFRFGGAWTAVIAAQVAVTLLFPAAAFLFNRLVVAGQTRDVGFAANEYLATRLAFERESAPGVPADASGKAFQSRVRRTYVELERRLTNDTQVAGVTFADRLPGMQHARMRIDVEGEEIEPRVSAVRTASVAPNFFEVVDTLPLAGRTFTSTDVEPGRAVAIVNQSFVEAILGGRNPIGRRIRESSENEGSAMGGWLEIVGVVPDLGMGSDGGRPSPGIYRPALPEEVPALRLAIRARSGTGALADRLRAIAGDVDPALQIYELMTLDAVGADQWLESQYLSRAMAVLSAIALCLSLSAIYAVMAFTVSKRTREIGIRVSLGADRRRVIGVILRRPLTQVAIGLAGGSALVALAFIALSESAPTALEAALIALYSLLMTGVCLLACIVPVRRALRVAPAEVLRVDA